MQNPEVSQQPSQTQEITGYIGNVPITQNAYKMGLFLVADSIDRYRQQQAQQEVEQGEKDSV